jgi:hypothetical protein
MNITVKGLIKTAVVGVIAYGAGKLSMLGKLVVVCKDRPEDVKEAINNVCDMWETLKESKQTEVDDTDNTAEEAEEEETAPVIEVTSAEEETEDLEDQPED